MYKPDRIDYVKNDYGINTDKFFFASKDETKLHAWHIKADKLSFKNNLRKGTIIFFHGNDKNLTAHLKKIDWLTKEGFQILMVDFRGFGKSEGTPNQKGVHLDALASLEQGLKIHELYPAEKLIVYGQGLGGVAAARAIPESKVHKKIDLVVMDSSYHSYEDLTFDKVAEKWYMVPLSPFTYIAVSDKMASTKYLTKISPTPLLVIHGIKDKTIPYKFGADLYHHASEPKWFWSITDGGHSDVFEAHDKIYRKKFLNFVSRKVRSTPRELASGKAK